MGRDICLVGAASRTREWIHEIPESVELWGMNENNTFQHRADRWFQIHPRNWREETIRHRGKFEPGNYGRPESHITFLAEHVGCPVYMQEVDDRIPNSVRYPFEEVRDTFGIEHFDLGKVAYLTSTAAYMIALALLEHMKGDTIDAIYAAGVEMQIGTEYSMQKPCVEYYLGWARALGIEWKPAPGNSLLRAPVYARDHDKPYKDDNWRGIGADGQKLDPNKAMVLTDS